MTWLKCISIREQLWLRLWLRQLLLECNQTAISSHIGDHHPAFSKFSPRLRQVRP